MRAELDQALAGEIHRRGLSAPARLLLDAHRPLAPLLSEVATFLSPVTDLFTAGRRDGLGRSLADPDAISRLMDRLRQGPNEEKG